MVPFFGDNCLIRALRFWKPYTISERMHRYVTEAPRAILSTGLTPSSQTQQRPFMFICHSLGGIILKHVWISISQRSYKNIGSYDRQAFSIFHQQANLDVLLDDVTSGIIFLRTPYTTSKDDKRWENWKWILKLTRKDISKQSQFDADINMLMKVCRHFEQLNLQIPVLSVCEAKQTKVREGLLQSIRNGNKNQIVSWPDSIILLTFNTIYLPVQLVDEELCCTGLKYEHIFLADSDHNELGLVKVESLFYNRLVKFFKSIAEEAPGNVALLFDKL